MQADELYDLVAQPQGDAPVKVLVDGEYLEATTSIENGFFVIKPVKKGE